MLNSKNPKKPNSTICCLGEEGRIPPLGVFPTDVGMEGGVGLPPMGGVGVFPTDVGMEGMPATWRMIVQGLSHGCGDGGEEGKGEILGLGSFPRMWGWRE